MKEYNISLCKLNKRFAIKSEDRIIRIKEYLQNIWTVRKFLDTYGEETFVKENYMLSRERVTCFTQLCSDPKVDLKPEFVFKGKGTRTHLTPPEVINYQ